MRLMRHSSAVHQLLPPRNLHTLPAQQNAPKASRSMFFCFSENYLCSLQRYFFTCLQCWHFCSVMCLKYHRVDFQQPLNSIRVLLNKQVRLCPRCRQLTRSSVRSLQKQLQTNEMRRSFSGAVDQTHCPNNFCLQSMFPQSPSPTLSAYMNILLLTHD